MLIHSVHLTVNCTIESDSIDVAINHYGHVLQVIAPYIGALSPEFGCINPRVDSQSEQMYCVQHSCSMRGQYNVYPVHRGIISYSFVSEHEGFTEYDPGRSDLHCG